MIVRIFSAGTSFKGLSAYLTHDPDAETAERVAWTHTHNLANDHVNSAVDEMLWTAIERIERALVLLAYFIELDGDVHLPMYEKFEAELTELKALADVRTRASERLEAYRQAGERKAICAKNLSLSSSEGPLPYFGL